ncbi:MAG: 4Fe-4S dicluster domain-containing protein, partial [Elusimicrobiota bacterium]|nr:4Fe-4S dicluster domain-containing protein [Elusimicrobiota bacterium]
AKYDTKSINIPVTCQQCTKPICVDLCISGALTFFLYGRKKVSKERPIQINKVVTIDESKCRGCKMCITSCPFGAIAFIKEKSIARKCDLCVNITDRTSDMTNQPYLTECMKFCPYNAIELVSEEKLSQKLKRRKVKFLLKELYQTL